MSGRVEVPFVIQPGFVARLAVLTDISETGLGLLASEPVEPGSTLTLWLSPGLQNDSRRMATAMVRHCTLCAAGAWILGCVLSHPLSRDDMLGLIATEDTALSFTL